MIMTIKVILNLIKARAVSFLYKQKHLLHNNSTYSDFKRASSDTKKDCDIRNSAFL